MAAGGEFEAVASVASASGDGGLEASAGNHQAVGPDRVAEERLRDILETMPYGVQEIDRTGVIRYANGVLHRLLGYQDGELIGEGIWDLYPDEEARRALSRDLARVLEEEPEPTPRFALNVRKDGSLVELQVDWNYRRDSRGQVVGIISVITDITAQRNADLERERLRRELQHAQKMEALGQLTGGVAHDFNNILASVLGYTGLALSRMDQLPQTKLRSYLQEVQTAGYRARDLVAQMLDFARGTERAPRRLALRPFLKEAVKLLESTLPSSIHVHLDVSGEVPDVLADPVQVHQILMNLFINARDAMGGAGTLRIALDRARDLNFECATCHRRIQGDWVLISVIDTGTGIAPELLDRIFDPFFTTKEPGRGTGMGLAVVRTAVERLGGHVLVESRPGSGTTFRLVLPALPVPAASGAGTGPLAAGTPPSGRGEWILVADDEAPICAYLKEFLEAHGYRVQVAANGVEALALATAPASAPALVVSDQTMPGLTGVELARRLRGLRPELPVVLCTGYSDVVDPAESPPPGVARVLLKPLDSAVLLRALRDLLDGAGSTGT